MGQCKKCGVKIPKGETRCQSCTRKTRVIIQKVVAIIPFVLAATVHVISKGKIKLK